MREDLHDEFARVSGTLVIMARAVRETMRQAGAALLAADPTLAQQAVDRGVEIGVLHRVAEDRAYDLVAGRRPAPAGLRMVITAVNVAADLKRMGELAVHVARATLRRNPAPAVTPELAGLFQAMNGVADELAGKIVAALAGRDAVLAAQLDGDDDEMDRLHTRLFSVMLSPEWPLGVEAAIDGALLGRYYERFADRAVNVGRHVVDLAADPAGVTRA
ncbi:PhoU domain-containing protein [Actinoplanes sp. NPDC048796]|uniref:phosphate signaling complex PhoU family protein n=1 Tax=unclassified Actinoplanes TaxID=2626549 RepID=UPI00340380B0